MTSALSSNWNLNDFLFYIKKENEILAQGYYSCQSSPNKFTVLKGAKCCRDFKPSVGRHHQNNDGRSRYEIKQQDLINDGTLMPEGDILLLTKNHKFDSPSQASIIILGTSNSGRGTWKNERGVSIKELETQGYILMDNNTGENLDKTSRRIQRESENSKADLPISPGELQEKLLQEFEDKVSSISQTEIKQLGHKQRIGQDILRKYLMMYWGGQCPLTRINDEDLLRASHIKPWTKCENNTTRLNLHNCLLLSALWDAAFDKGLVTFDVKGQPHFSTHISLVAKNKLECDCQKPIPLKDEHKLFLKWHHHNVFLGEPPKIHE